ncbi:MAG: hypothetical protein U0X40_06815 [Ferruginibacter sp.]
MKKLFFTLFITFFFSLLFIVQQLVKLVVHSLSRIPGLRRYSLRLDI